VNNIIGIYGILGFGFQALNFSRQAFSITFASVGFL
jgi:hypothetical protein